MHLTVCSYLISQWCPTATTVGHWSLCGWLGWWLHLTSGRSTTNDVGCSFQTDKFYFPSKDGVLALDGRKINKIFSYCEPIWLRSLTHSGLISFTPGDEAISFQGIKFHKVQRMLVSSSVRTIHVISDCSVPAVLEHARCVIKIFDILQPRHRISWSGCVSKHKTTL